MPHGGLDKTSCLLVAYSDGVTGNSAGWQQYWMPAVLTAWRCRVPSIAAQPKQQPCQASTVAATAVGPAGSPALLRSQCGTSPVPPQEQAAWPGKVANIAA